MQFFVRAISEKSQKQYISPIFYRHQSKKDQNTSLINELLNMPNFFFHQKRSSTRASLFVGAYCHVEPPMSHKKNFQSFDTDGFGIT